MQCSSRGYSHLKTDFLKNKILKWLPWLHTEKPLDGTRRSPRYHGTRDYHNRKGRIVCGCAKPTWTEGTTLSKIPRDA